MNSSGSYSAATKPSYGASTRITGDYTSGFEGYTSGQKSGSASTPPRLAYSEGYSSPHTEEMDLSLSGSTTVVPATSPAPQEMTAEYATQKEQEIRDMLYARRTGASEEDIQKMAGTYQFRQTEQAALKKAKEDADREAEESIRIAAEGKQAALYGSQSPSTSPTTGEETKTPSLSAAEAQSRAYAEDAKIRAMEDGMKRDAYFKSLQEQKGDISKEDIDYSKISRTAQSASDGQFIDRSKVKDQYWGDGHHQLTYEKRGDGTVLIREDGVAMGFTTEDALRQKSVDSVSQQIEAEKAKIHDQVWSAPAAPKQQTTQTASETSTVTQTKTPTGYQEKYDSTIDTKVLDEMAATGDFELTKQLYAGDRISREDATKMLDTGRASGKISDADYQKYQQQLDNITPITRTVSPTYQVTEKDGKTYTVSKEPSFEQADPSKFTPISEEYKWDPEAKNYEKRATKDYYDYVAAGNNPALYRATEEEIKKMQQNNLKKLYKGE